MRIKYNHLYPIGFFGLAFVNTLYTQWLVYFHAPPSGIEQPRSTTLIGVFMLGGFILQGILNPWVGYRADRLVHPWGRRRPFILFGTLPFVLVFFCLWQTQNIWLTMPLVLLYSVLFMIISQPYSSLLPTLATTPTQRTNFSIIAVLLGLTASGAALIGGPLLLEQFSFASLGVIGALVFLLMPFGITLLLREPISEKPLNTQNLSTNLRAVLTPRVLQFLMGNGLLFVVMTALTIISPYISEALLSKTRSYTSLLNGWLFGGMLLSLLLLSQIWKKIPLLRLFQSAALVGGLTLLLMSMAGFLNWDWLPLWWLGFGLSGFLVLSLLVLPPLILSEFADQDGQGREGLFFGLSGLAVNIGNAIAAVLTGGLLSLGYTVENPSGVQLILLVVALISLGVAVLFMKIKN